MSPCSRARVVTLQYRGGELARSRAFAPLGALNSACHDGPRASRGRHRKQRATVILDNALH